MTPVRPIQVLSCLFLFCTLAISQTTPLKKYTQCQVGNFQIVQVDPAPGSFVRTVDTDEGPKQVEVVEGYRVLMTYDNTEPFINMKVERLKKASYKTEKQILIDSQAYVTKGSEMESPRPIQSQRNGFDIYGINRKELAGGVLSIYTLFRDSDLGVVTVYFLNAEPSDRKFQTVSQYRQIRDSFLDQFTACAARP